MRPRINIQLLIRQLRFAGKVLYLIEEKISFRNPIYPCFGILFLLQKAFHCIQEIARFFNPFWQHSSNIFSAHGRSLHNIEAGRSFLAPVSAGCSKHISVSCATRNMQKKSACGCRRFEPAI
jgi:hypothetical protein